MFLNKINSCYIMLKYKTVTQYNLKEDMEKHGIKVKKSLTLEEEYEKLKENLILLSSRILITGKMFEYQDHGMKKKK
ncbi:cytochrome c oxidase assembly protein COX16 homolog l(3)neo43 isoform X3 [Ptiloglossa arizonensis]|uniref:cytochrome c oxidase assembly protein COX16 homolog l(3)neo43 isoform X3 n=1 Tax=Ptiloglossa arizonensis TaxID=3350558 RepID=UPI003F9F7495